MKKDIKIMYLNPIGLDGYDAFFAAMVQENKFPETEVHVASLASSVGQMDNLEFRAYNALVAADIIKATRQAATEGFDALIIGCFYDPFLLEAREVSGDMVVVAPCHSSIEVALKLANKFSVIIGQNKWEYEMHSTIRDMGHEHHLASFRDVNMSVCEFQKDHDFTANALLQASHSAVEEDFAEAIILGCTCEFGFYQKIQAELNVPVIDPSLAALKQAEHSAILKKNYNWKPSRKWSCEAPVEADIKAFGLFGKEYEFGNRIVVK